MRRMFWLAVALLAAGCSGDTDRPRSEAGVSDGSLGDRPPAPKMTWSKKVIDPAEAGKHASIAVSGSKVGIAYFRAVTPDPIVTCPPTGVQTEPTDKARPAQDLMMVQSNDLSTWSTPAKVDQTVGETQGCSLAYDQSGKAYLGYLGGAISKNECASSDAVIASSADGTTFSKSTLLAQGPVGDTVGYWMAVAVDSKGTAHAAFRDVRFGYYEAEGKQKASARYDASDVIALENGAGEWNALVFDPSDNPIVIYFNAIQKGPDGGIQLALKKSGAWQTYQLVPGATKEKMGLARSPLGPLGMSYYEPGQQQMKFMESDATNYQPPWKGQTVDNDGHNGEFSSIAYDSKGNPAVSYYKCGSYDPGSTTCDGNKDGLRFAWRKDGTNWSVYDVDGGDNRECGTYTSLAFVNDLPVIAYRCVTFDSTTQEFKGALKVAKGAMQ